MLPRGPVAEHNHAPDLPKILEEALDDSLVHFHGQLRHEDGALVFGQLVQLSLFLTPLVPVVFLVAGEVLGSSVGPVVAAGGRDSATPAPRAGGAGGGRGAGARAGGRAAATPAAAAAAVGTTVASI